MRKTLMISMAVFMLVGVASISVLSAKEKKSEAKSVQEGVVINDVCSVMGGEVDKDTSYKTEYKGKTIGFCCPGCIKKFEKNPEKYMAKLKGKKKCVITCPKCGEEIDITEQCKKMMSEGMCPMMKGKKSMKKGGGKHEGHKH